MGNCFITRRGGGGGTAGLNFSVVGGTSQPTNPDENTIWINTSTEIANWVFSVSEPDAPTTGTVWITIGTAELGSFNAIKAKENLLFVYPLSAKQYISGAWVEKDALIYQNGEWKSWVQDLWVVEAGVAKYTMQTTAAGTEGAYVVTSVSGGAINFRGSATGYYAIGFGPFDLTNYKSVVATGVFFAGAVTDYCLSVAKTFTLARNDYAAAADLTSTGATLDVSKLTGNYYIVLNTVYNKQQALKNLQLKG